MREEIVIVKRFKFIGKEIRCLVTRGRGGEDWKKVVRGRNFQV